MRITLIISIMFLLSTLTTAQSVVLKGFVNDKNGEALTGINVFIKNSYDGTTTDFEGKFEFITEEQGLQSLRFQSIGFETLDLPINLNDSLTIFNIILKESINELTAVTITAGAMETSDERKAVVLRPIDIVTVPGAMGDIIGALQTLPGTSAVGNDGRLFVRGGDASETALFIDGMRVGNAFGTTASNVPTRTRFNPNLFKGSFFSTGGYSAEYGQALSSALALSTLEMPLRDQSDLSISSVGGGFTQTFVGKNNSLTASANYFNLSPYQKLIKQNFDWEKAPRGLDVEMSARQKWGTHGIVKLFAHTENNSLSIRQPQPGNSGRVDLTTIRNQYHFVQSTFRQPGKNDWSYSGGISYSHNWDDISINNFNIQRKNQLLHGKMVGMKSFSSQFSLKTGLESYSIRYSEHLHKINLNADYFDQQVNIFTEGDYYFTNQFILRAGIRSGKSTLANEIWVDPRFSLAYKLEDESQFSLAAGTFSQLPPENERILNHHLLNTKAQHLLLNYVKTDQGRTIRVEAFYKNYDKLISHEVSGQSFNIMQQGEGYARGFDLFYRDRTSLKNTDFWITYSFIDSKRKFNHFTTLVQPSFAPKNNISVVIKHFINTLNSQLSLSMTINDGYTYTDPNFAGEMNRKTKSFQDLSLGWSYLPRPSLIIHLACSNIWGRENIFGYQFSPEPGSDGMFESLPILQGAPRFLFLGFFVTFSKDKNANQLNNL